MKVKNNSYIGVDVAKATLDAHRFPENLSRQFANTPEGWKQFLQWIKDESLERILNCCGLFEGKSPLPEGEGTLFGSPDQNGIRSNRADRQTNREGRSGTEPTDRRQ